MTIEEANNEILKISENPGLSSDAKKSRIRVYQTYIMSLNSEEEIFRAMKEYTASVGIFIRLTNGLYQCLPKVADNELFLRGYILESSVCKELAAKNINYTHTDLKLTYIPEYEARYNADLSDVSMAILLYDHILKIQNIKNNQITTVSHNLAELLSPEIIYKESRQKYVDRNGHVAVKTITKSKEQLEQDYQKAIIMINELYNHNMVLDNATKQIALDLIRDLFDSYQEDKFKFPSVLIDQIDTPDNLIA